MKYEEVKKRVLDRNPPSIKTKKECYLLFEKGFFGNKTITWRSHSEIIKSGWNGTVSMRSRNKYIDRSRVVYNIPIENIQEEINRWKDQKIEEDAISFSQTPPDNNLIIQGEVMKDFRGVHLTYTTIKKPMNIALSQETKFLSGLSALNLLKQSLCVNSFHDIMELLELFPNDSIEFSSYSKNFGTIPNRNTIIWEVRNY